MILIIDNYDSFTYNLVQTIEALGYECEVFANDRISVDEIRQKKPDKIVISPGPGSPKDAGISRAVIESFYESTPLLGVCLGHQCIGLVFGAELIHSKNILHGKTSAVKHSETRLFKDISEEFEVARYHSLAIHNITSPLKITAKAADGTIMAVEHEDYPVYGVQFHPESFMTPMGKKIIRNFLT